MHLMSSDMKSLRRLDMKVKSQYELAPTSHDKYTLCIQS